ncbi:M50 family metallopeptidase [Bacillaceae bacterium SIJ1]|uniref:M50 family metallopeptidase n=1 Tax=Litoribacterium kuwaitense TaxID=1398745 RepID=UPI0013EBC0A4|nr:M50 family metallopeptidase [Litoribacterium kuwaitense]NGP44424.1 M50 family metallopeptidase [Litoribacterium kuwaitense]
MNWKLILICLVCFILLYVPGVQMILRTWNTLVHESGHAVAALLVGGQVNDIQLFANLSGLTRSWTASGWPVIVVSLAGYLSSSIVLLLFSWLWKKKIHHFILMSVGLIALLSGLFWVRNLFGIIWIAVLLIGLIYLLSTQRKSWSAGVSLCFILILLVDSVRAAFDLLLLSFFSPARAGDASILASTTWVPALVWGCAFAIVSVWAAWRSVVLVAPAFRTARTALEPNNHF